VREVVTYWAGLRGKAIYRIVESSQKAWYAWDTTGWQEDRRVLGHVGIGLEPQPLSRADAIGRLRQMGACPDPLDGR
jgi:hypothetical protein